MRANATQQIGLEQLKSHSIIVFKLDLLLYDMYNVQKDPSSCRRILKAVDPLYICAPYFTDIEAERIKSTLVSSKTSITRLAENVVTEYIEQEMPELVTIREALQAQYNYFKSKQRLNPQISSELAPIWQMVFEIDAADLRKERLGDKKLLEMGIET